MGGSAMVGKGECFVFCRVLCSGAQIKDGGRRRGPVGDGRFLSLPPSASGAVSSELASEFQRAREEGGRVPQRRAAATNAGGSGLVVCGAGSEHHRCPPAVSPGLSPAQTLLATLLVTLL